MEDEDFRYSIAIKAKVYLGIANNVDPEQVAQEIENNPDIVKRLINSGKFEISDIRIHDTEKGEWEDYKHDRDDYY